MTDRTSSYAPLLLRLALGAMFLAQHQQHRGRALRAREALQLGRFSDRDGNGGHAGS